jgi:hypothetical protein
MNAVDDPLPRQRFYRAPRLLPPEDQPAPDEQ